VNKGKTILIDAINAKSGGANEITQSLLDEFSNCGAKDKLIIVQLSSFRNKRKWKKNVEFILIKDAYYNPITLFLWHLIYLPYLARKRNVTDLIGLSGLFLFRNFLKSIRVAITINNTIPFQKNSLLKVLFPEVRLRIKFKVMYFLYMRSIRLTDEVIVPSESIRKQILAKDSTLKNKVNVQQTFKVVTSKERCHFLELKRKKNVFRLVYLSPIWLYKNHITVLKALKILNKNRSVKFELTIIGEFKQKEAESLLKTYIRENDLAENVFFVGFLSGKAKTEYLESADMLIFASMLEAYSTILVEYSNFGKPILCSNIEPNVAVLRDLAIYFPVKDYVKLSEIILETCSSYKISDVKYTHFNLNYFKQVFNL